MNFGRIAIGCIVLFAGLDGSAVATLTLADGGYHIIDYQINDVLSIDQFDPGLGTTVELVEGGYISAWIRAYMDSRVIINGGQVLGTVRAQENSHVTILDGRIGEVVSARNNARLDISGGSMGSLVQTFDDAEATISGGSIAEFVQSVGDSRITISGGTIGESISAVRNSLITLVGRDFAVDGTAVEYGDLASMYSSDGAITGILANGDALDVEYYLRGRADILFVPEPASFLLLGLGGLGLLKRRKR